MPSPLIEIQPIAYNEITAVQPTKLQIDIHLLIWPFHQHHSIHSLRFHLFEQLDQLLQSVACIMDVFNYQNMLVVKLLGLELGLKCQFSCRLSPSVTLAPHELMSMAMFDSLDQVRKEHECALQHADNY